MNMKHTPKTSLTAVLIYVAAILASIAVVSCRIHEYPVGPGVDPTMIVVNIDLTTDPAVAETSTIGRSDEDGCMYFIMEIYRNDFTGEPVSRLESGAVRAEDGSSSVRFTDTCMQGTIRSRLLRYVPRICREVPLSMTCRIFPELSLMTHIKAPFH